MCIFSYCDSVIQPFKCHTFLMEVFTMLKRVLVSMVVLFVLLASHCFAERYAVVIGISAYRDSNIVLKYAHRDAMVVVERLKAGGMGSDNITVLIDGQATMSAINTAFTNLLTRLRPGDSLFVYFSGHGSQGPDVGIQDEDDGRDEYIVPCDGIVDQPTTWIRDDIFGGDWISPLRCSLIVIIFDCCHGGGAAKSIGPDVKSLLSDDFLKDIRKEDTFILSACRASEDAMESPERGHSIFTYYFMKAFANDRKLLDDRELFRKLIVEPVRRESNNRQMPQMSDNTPVKNPISLFFPLPSITITYPVEGSLVPPRCSVRGTSFGIEQGTHICVYIISDREYPQGDGAVSADGSWEVNNCCFGEPGRHSGVTFYIKAVVEENGIPLLESKLVEVTRR